MMARDVHTGAKPRLLVAAAPHQVPSPLIEELQDHNYDVHLATTTEDALDHSRAQGTDLLLLDEELPGSGLLPTLREARAPTTAPEVVVVVNPESLPLALTALDHGAFDYIVRPLNAGHLLQILGNARALGRLVRDNQRLRDDVHQLVAAVTLLAESDAALGRAFTHSISSRTGPDGSAPHPPMPAPGGVDGSAGAVEKDFSLEYAVRNHLARVLSHTQGNVSRAARLLGVRRGTLYNKIKKYGLSTQPYR